MADKSIVDLTQATQITNDDLFVLQQGSEAKKLKGETLLDFVTLSVISVSVTTLPAGSQATASYSKSTGVLSLGIPQGDKGATGDPGPKGETGATGDPGPKGETGAQGPQGEKGDTGAAGPEGPRGPQGEKGDTGSTGPQGPKGDTGSGFRVLGYYDTKAALDAAQKAAAQAGDAYGVGSAEPYDIYIFDGISGEFVNNGPLQGAKGDKGDTGPQGPKGDTGDIGPQGPQGETGPQGPQGDTGAKGAAGDTGPKGADGTTFTPSVDASGNLSWTNDGGKANPAEVNIKGPKGDQGEQGPQGETGPQGPQGEQGPAGPVNIPTTTNLLKGDGSGGMRAATAGTDYTTPANVRTILNRTNNVNVANTSYTTYMARGEALFSTETTPTVNGCIAWQYG